MASWFAVGHIIHNILWAVPTSSSFQSDLSCPAAEVSGNCVTFGDVDKYSSTMEQMGMVILQILLVGGWAYPLKNHGVQVNWDDYSIPNMMGKKLSIHVWNQQPVLVSMLLNAERRIPMSRNQLGVDSGIPSVVPCGRWCTQCQVKLSTQHPSKLAMHSKKMWWNDSSTHIKHVCLLLVHHFMCVKTRDIAMVINPILRVSTGQSSSHVGDFLDGSKQNSSKSSQSLKNHQKLGY